MRLYVSKKIDFGDYYLIFVFGIQAQQVNSHKIVTDVEE